MPKFRQFLADSRVPNYMKVPVYQGDKAKAMAERFPEIANYLKQLSAYTIIVILNDNGYEWADVNNLSLPNRIRAEAMLEHFVSSL